MPAEDVVNVLRTLHGALRPGGVLVDTQPVSRRPRVKTARGQLGTLDQTEWRRTIDRIDRRIQRAVRAGLFRLDYRDRFTVTDYFETAAELLDVVPSWDGTRIDRALRRRIADEPGPIRLEQVVRLQLLHANQRHHAPA